MTLERKEHWDHVYKTKNANEVSWTQEKPNISLQLINSFGVPKTAKIIDIGGGDSKLVDYLLAAGYKNITVLDISAEALEKSKTRLGKKAAQVNWIVCDITRFETDTIYDVWHDRAAFHFLTAPVQIKQYITTAKKVVSGFLVIGAFSKNGPFKCSGLEITQYNEIELKTLMQDGFKSIHCTSEDHTTPFNTQQNFLFCSFKRQ
ncbi:class I SAM-dependent methyltransferase [Polaribacter sp.]|jgi:ubiquinone/menaquinone biosynthesis C-methylase UbiE|uniref:class I SAM-dependent methyltransferase n=1 Tax=uncultured Polaribacter sp. TaxID=174711 RepID=UPI00233B017F|nr:class I SAM-dependent methyltransferase [Polaribacter sp.]|tara:strand:- start:143 stop:754 length:612 start_codon:yes stop_codon:yes gene_type:complete